MAMVLGRPRTIHREDCTTPPPLDCDFPSEPSKTVPLATNHVRQPPTAITITMFWIAISHKVHDMLSMRARKIDRKDYSKVQKLHQEIDILLDDLPAPLKPDSPDTSWDNMRPQLVTIRQRIRTTTSIFLTALHRPYLATHPESRNCAISAALVLLQAQQRLFEMISEPQYKLFAYSFYTVDSALFLMSMIIEKPVEEHELHITIHHELQQAIDRIAAMKERSHIARSGEQILKKCYQSVQFSSPPGLSVGSGSSYTITDTLNREPQPQVSKPVHNFGLCDTSLNNHFNGLIEAFDTGFISMDQLYGSPGSMFATEVPQYDSNLPLLPDGQNEFQSQYTGQMGNDTNRGSW